MRLPEAEFPAQEEAYVRWGDDSPGQVREAEEREMSEEEPGRKRTTSMH